MSWNRNNGGGRRRNYRDDYQERETHESPEDRLKRTIIKFGDADAEAELPRLSKHLRELELPNIPTVAEGFRLAVTEQPYKIPHYATLLRSLDQHAENKPEVPLGKQILDDIWRGFQILLDKMAWRDVRLSVQFFAHLTSARVISTQSLLSLLQSFVAVLEEFGVSHSRAKHAALCTAEGIIIAGPSLKSHSPLEVSNMINSIETYAEVATTNNFLVCPIVRLHNSTTTVSGVEEILEVTVSVLKTLDSSGFSENLKSMTQPYEKDDDGSFMPYFDLPSVLVPPEVVDLENLPDGGTSTMTHKNDDWPEYRLQLFDPGVAVDARTALGYVVNSTVSDIIDIFEINRKECAKILLELPRWFVPGTFKPRPNTPDKYADGPSWQLESVIVEIILSKLTVLPKASHKSVYYVALITELCKMSPQTTGPAVGKSIRRLYSFLADGLDVEVAQRLSTWFAAHMSNFGFQWVWKEWILDLQLVTHHPKRNFIRRAVEIEIRLAYYDRIIKTLPEAYLSPEVDVVPDQAPNPEFEFEDPLKPHHDAAQALLNLFKGRTKADGVITHIESMKNMLAEAVDADVNVDTLIRTMTMQSLLNIGSRSFSHFLNAIERYLPVLRHLTTSSDAKLDILLAAAQFWRRNNQMILIVFDKLMQYQIVDPSDVILWAFSGSGTASARHTIDTFRWNVIEAALDKANGRVAIAKRKVYVLQKEEDESRARVKAGGSMEIDADGTVKAEDVSPEQDSPHLQNALKAHATLTKEQKTVLSRTLSEFVESLHDTSSVLSEEFWERRASWENADWEVWETWCWYRNYCRLYVPYLRTYGTTLSTVGFSKIAGSSDDAASLLKKIWSASTGQEV